LTERRDPVLHMYLQHKYNKNAELLENLERNVSEAALQRCQQLLEEQRELAEVLDLWN